MHHAIRVLAAGALLAFGGTACAQHQMFKCGSTYQDRPCAEVDVQKRFAPAAGRFDVDQVNADTDRDCARLVSTVMPYWTRLKQGETLEALRAEFDAKPVARSEKSAMRDLLIVMRDERGTPTQARSHFESQCMAYKQRKGIPTERQLEAAAGSPAGNSAAAPTSSAAYARAMAAQRRAEFARARAEAAARRAETGR